MNFIVISPIAADNFGNRPIQWAKELAARGHAVVYVEVEKSREPNNAANPRIVSFQALGWDELELLRAWYGFEYAAPKDGAPPKDAAARVLEVLPASTERGVVICAAPFRPALEMLPALAAQNYALVYDVLDDVSEMRALGSYCYDELAETWLAEHADLIVTLSPHLTEKFRGCERVELIRDGVELAPFRGAGKPGAVQPNGDAQGLEHLERGEVTLGFWGTMWDYNMDISLLRSLTHARPQWQWHFIGAYDLDPARPSIAAALAAPNVHFHRGVSRAALARAAESFDVCIVPSPVTPFNLARDPLKVYEYLACGKPVVATNLPQLTDMPHVFLSRDEAEFLANVEQAVHVRIDRRALDTYLNEQTWAKRTDALLAALASLAPASSPLPAPQRGAMPEAKDDLARWQAYTRHLERLVRDREGHVTELERALQESALGNKLKRVFGAG